MSIFENKRVVALSAVFAVAFAGIAYYGYDRMAAFQQTQAGLKEIDEGFQDQESAEIPPTVANLQTLRKAHTEIKQQKDAMQAILAKYAAACEGNGASIRPIEFQNQVLSSIDEMSRKAKELNCNIATPAADLGMTSYKSAAAREDHVPYLHFQLRAVRRLADIVMEASSPSLEKIYCAPLPDELTENRRKAQPDYFPLGIEIAFQAKRSEVTDGSSLDKMSVLPQVLNRISSDNEFFFLVTGVAVSSNNPNLPPLDPYKNPNEAAGRGDDLSAAVAPAGAEKGAPPTRRIAVQKAGLSNETVHVHLTVQVLYFNPNAAKGNNSNAARNR